MNQIIRFTKSELKTIYVALGEAASDRNEFAQAHELSGNGLPTKSKSALAIARRARCSIQKYERLQIKIASLLSQEAA